MDDPRQKSCCSLTLLYISGKTVVIVGQPSEFNIEKRRGWIEKKIRKTNDYSIENISKCIKMSIFWRNYVEHGCKYNVISEEQYKKWEREKYCEK